MAVYPPNPSAPTTHKICQAFRRSGNSGSEFLIGNIFMKHYDFNFDRDTRQVSFVRSFCDEEKTVKLQK